MKKTCIIYGSTTGTTESVAGMIASKMGIEDNCVYNASDLTPDLINQFDALILGSSTWGDGELQDDWYDAVKILKGMDLQGKIIALFGCGDSESYSDTFCDAIGLLYEELKATGGEFVGSAPSSDYQFGASVAEVDGRFVGLPLDEMNESHLTDSRIEKWIETIKPYFT